MQIKQYINKEKNKRKKRMVQIYIEEDLYQAALKKRLAEDLKWTELISAMLKIYIKE